jgi:hypothetical protein
MEFTDNQKHEMYERSKTKKSCPACGIVYQSAEDVRSLLDAAKDTDKSLYNMLFIQVFCENRYKPKEDGFACSYENNLNWFNFRDFELPNKCPECEGKLLGTALLMRVNVGGIVESFCIKCKHKFSQSQPFKRI